MQKDEFIVSCFNDKGHCIYCVKGENWDGPSMEELVIQLKKNHPDTVRIYIDIALKLRIQ